MDSLPIWAIWSTIPGVVVLAPVLAFLLATATVIIIGLLKEVAVPAVLAFTAAGISGWLLARKARRGGQRRSSLTRRSDVSNAVPAAPTSAQSGRASPQQARTRLHAAGRWIRTFSSRLRNRDRCGRPSWGAELVARMRKRICGGPKVRIHLSPAVSPLRT